MFLPAADGGIYIEAEAALENSAYAWSEAGRDADQSAWMETLGAMSEGTQTTLGAYHRKWQ